MPQEFHVLKCFSCETFQVQIVKKNNKWQCKMCGIKQSLKKVYGQGSSQMCRQQVQQMNGLRVKLGVLMSENESNRAPHREKEVASGESDVKGKGTGYPADSKWNVFLQDTEDEDYKLVVNENKDIEVYTKEGLVHRHTIRQEMDESRRDRPGPKKFKMKHQAELKVHHTPKLIIHDSDGYSRDHPLYLLFHPEEVDDNYFETNNLTRVSSKWSLFLNPDDGSAKTDAVHGNKSKVEIESEPPKGEAAVPIEGERDSFKFPRQNSHLSFQVNPFKQPVDGFKAAPEQKAQSETFPTAVPKSRQGNEGSKNILKQTEEKLATPLDLDSSFGSAQGEGDYIIISDDCEESDHGTVPTPQKSKAPSVQEKMETDTICLTSDEEECAASTPRVVSSKNAEKLEISTPTYPNTELVILGQQPANDPRANETTMEPTSSKAKNLKQDDENFPGFRASWFYRNQKFSGLKRHFYDEALDDFL